MEYEVEFYESDDDEIVTLSSKSPFPDLQAEDRIVLSTNQTAGRENWIVRERTVLFTDLRCKVMYRVTATRAPKRGQPRAARSP